MPNWTGRKNVQRCKSILSKFDPAMPLIELFGGTGRISLMHGHGVWNDINKTLHHAACMIRDDPTQMVQRCTAMSPDLLPPDKTARLRTMVQTITLEPWQLAYIAMYSFAGRLTGRLHLDQHRHRAWRLWIQNVPIISRCLEKITLCNLPWERCIQAFGIGQCYADPPYTSSHIENYGSIKRHSCQALALALERYHHAVISDYCPILRPGWIRTHVPKTHNVVNMKMWGVRQRMDETDSAWNPLQFQCELLQFTRSLTHGT